MNTRSRPAESQSQTIIARDSIESHENSVRVNGLEQVIDLLKHADPSFRSSLLKRLQARDPELARKLVKLIR